MHHAISLLDWIAKPVRRLARDERGVSAVEFAMLLPLMLTLYLGAVEISQGIAADRKVTLVSRTVADLAVVRPIHLAIIDGVESMAGGEGPWIRGVKAVKPGVLLAGQNPVSIDTVGTAVMGFDPRAGRGTRPFKNDADNTMLLAEAHGVGAVDLSRIEVRGVSIADAMYRF